MKRKQFIFSDALDERVRELAKDLGVDQTAVVREGLRLVGIAVRESKHGNKLGLVCATGVVHELLGPWNDVATPAAASVA